MGIRSFLRTRALKKLGASNSGSEGYPGFAAVENIAICSDWKEGDNSRVDQLISELEAKGKKVFVIVYVPLRSKQMNQIPKLSWFCKDHVNWLGKPRTKSVEEFLSRDYGAYIDLNESEGSPADFISATVRAQLKISSSFKEFMDFDLALDLSAKKSESPFKQLMYYLEFINNDKK